MGLSQALQQPFWVVFTPWRLMSAWRLPNIESNWFCLDPLTISGGGDEELRCGCGLGELLVALLGFAYGESVTVWCWWVLALIWNIKHTIQYLIYMILFIYQEFDISYLSPKSRKKLLLTIKNVRNSKSKCTFQKIIWVLIWKIIVKMSC